MVCYIEILIYFTISYLAYKISVFNSYIFLVKVEFDRINPSMKFKLTGAAHYLSILSVVNSPFHNVVDIFNTEEEK